jgi:hypothetical protein
MLRTGVACLMAAVLPLVGCRGQEPQDYPVEEREPYEELFGTAATTEAYQTDEAAPVTPVQGGEVVGGPLTATGNLQGPPGSPPPGTVTVTQANGNARISMTIQRAGAQPLQAAVIQGTCQQPGQPVHRMENLQAGQDGILTVDQPIPVPAATVLDGRHAIRVTTQAGTTPGAGENLIGCADLPRVASPAGAPR